MGKPTGKIRGPSADPILLSLFFCLVAAGEAQLLYRP